MGKSRLSIGSVSPLVLLVAVLASCGERGQDDVPTEEIDRALTTITISGRVTDANGLALAHVTVTLSGNVQATKQTDAQGNYAFTGLNPGSYSVRPTLTGCAFQPDVVNLNNLTASSVQNFGGSGTACGGATTVNTGATSGPFTISGQLTDASGRRIVGGRVNMSGSASAVRFSDYTGRYTFHVAAGSYNLTAVGTGTCALSPANASLNNVNGNRTQNFSASGAGCITADPRSTSPTGQYLSVQQGTTPLGATLVRVEPRASAADAQAALQQIAQEQSAPVTNLTIAGFPAIERQAAVPTPEIELPSGGAAPDTLGITTAIAMNSTLVRFESRLAQTASAATINAFVFAGRNFGLEAVGSLSGPTPTPLPTSRAVGPTAGTPQILSAPGEIGLMNGELWVAASETSDFAVVATQSTVFWTNDFGKTTNVSALNTTAPTGGTSFNNAGDPAIAVGPYDGVRSPFYHSRLVAVTPGNSTTLPTVAIALFKSVDEGKTFNPTSNAFPINCFTSGTCVVPDQAMLAVDKKNRVNGNDQIYLAWRNFQATLAENIGLACSADGGATWKTDYVTLGQKKEDVPRLAVADDGSVFVAYVMPQNNQLVLKLQKFSSCNNGFTPPTAATPFPTQVAVVTDGGTLAGMPRQPGVTYSVAAADDTSKVVYVTYTTNASAGNDDVHVAQWSDTSQTWIKNDIVNSTSTGRRYFPAICTTGSTASVAWYDRRSGGDKTAYFRRTIINDGASLGHEYNVTGSGFDDSQCLTGFPGGGVGDPQAELLCTDLPTNNSLATGTCQLSTCATGVPVCGSQTSCDFRPGSVGGACSTANETCQVPFNGGVAPGAPTYGDYNGTACAKGRMFLAWATNTAPKDSCKMTGDACVAGSQCCSTICESGICKSRTGDCAGNGSACTTDADCCNGVGNPGVCQGGICFRRVGLFMATGGSAVSLHVTGTGTVVLFDNAGGSATFNQTFDETILIGLDGIRAQTAENVTSSPVGAGVSLGFKLQPNTTDLLVTGRSFGLGGTSVQLPDQPGLIVTPSNPFVFTTGLTTSFDPAAFPPYLGGTLSVTITYTPTVEP